MQTQVGASASGAPNKKPHRTSPIAAHRLHVRLLSSEDSGQRSTTRSPAPDEQWVQFTAPSREMHVANRDLGTVEHVTSNGDIRIRTDFRFARDSLRKPFRLILACSPLDSEN